MVLLNGGAQDRDWDLELGLGLTLRLRLTAMVAKFDARRNSGNADLLTRLITSALKKKNTKQRKEHSVVYL